MVLLTILLIILAVVAFVTVVAAISLHLAAFVMFGDVIVFVLIIYGVVKLVKYFKNRC